jgi:hypothetical protein
MKADVAFLIMCIGYIGIVHIANGFVVEGIITPKTNVMPTKPRHLPLKSSPYIVGVVITDPKINGHYSISSRFKLLTRSRDTGLNAATVISPFSDDTGNNNSKNNNNNRQQLLLSMWVNTIRSSMVQLLHNIRKDEVTQWRCAALLFVSSVVMFRGRIDVGLAKLWTYLTTSSTGVWAKWFRHDRMCIVLLNDIMKIGSPHLSHMHIISLDCHRLGMVAGGGMFQCVLSRVLVDRSSRLESIPERNRPSIAKTPSSRSIGRPESSS